MGFGRLNTFDRIVQVLTNSLIMPMLLFLNSASLAFYQAVKDDIGAIRIQKPHKGPFYVSHKTIDQVIASLGRWAR